MFQSIDNASVIDGRRVTSRWEGEEAVLERRLHGSYEIDRGTHLGDAYGMVGENVRWRLHLGIQFALLSVP